MIRHNGRIYNLALGEEPPDEPEGSYYHTPDGDFILDLVSPEGDSDRNRVVERFIAAAYETDMEKTRAMLVGAWGEVNAELEELCYRWKTGRLADFGFADFYDALAIYQHIDLTSLRRREAGVGLPQAPTLDRGEDALRMPTAVATQLEGQGAIARAVAGITDRNHVDALHFALVTLCNRALAADRVNRTMKSWSSRF